MDWTILMSGHEPDHSKDFLACSEELDMGTEVTLGSQAYQMEVEVDCHIGTSTPATGYSRSRGVGLAMRLTWCLGEPRRRKIPVRGGVSQGRGVPFLPCPLIEKPGSSGQMRWENQFPWQPGKKPSSNLPFRKQPDSGGKGAFCGTSVPTMSSSDWTDVLVQAQLQGTPTVKQPSF